MATRPYTIDRPTDDALSVREVAAALGCSVELVQKWIAVGAIETLNGKPSRLISKTRIHWVARSTVDRLLSMSDADIDVLRRNARQLIAQRTQRQEAQLAS